MSLLVKNIGTIAGIDESGRTRLAGEEMSRTGTLDNAWLLTDSNRIKEYGTMESLPCVEGHTVIDAKGGWLFPSFCDSHRNSSTR